MGGGIAMALANAGIFATLVDVSDQALGRCMATIAGNYAHSVKRGKIDQAEVNRRLALIKCSSDLTGIAAADIVIEAVFEDMDIKKDLFRNIDAFARPGAILATNTSALDINEIAAVTSRPEAVVGAHFFRRPT